LQGAARAVTIELASFSAPAAVLRVNDTADVSLGPASMRRMFTNDGCASEGDDCAATDPYANATFACYRRVCIDGACRTVLAHDPNDYNNTEADNTVAPCGADGRGRCVLARGTGSGTPVTCASPQRFSTAYRESADYTTSAARGAIACNGAMCCGVGARDVDGGTVYCWGLIDPPYFMGTGNNIRWGGEDGILYDTDAWVEQLDTDDVPRPMPVGTAESNGTEPLVGIDAVYTMGTYDAPFSCAIRREGPPSATDAGVWCWGHIFHCRGGYEMPGGGCAAEYEYDNYHSHAFWATPVPSNAGGVDALPTGFIPKHVAIQAPGTTCVAGLAPGDSVDSVWCFGYNNLGQAGTGSLVPTEVLPHRVDFTAAFGPGVGVVATTLASVGSQAFAVARAPGADRLAGWGATGFGQLGVGPAFPYERPTPELLMQAFPGTDIPRVRALSSSMWGKTCALFDPDGPPYTPVVDDPGYSSHIVCWGRVGIIGATDMYYEEALPLPLGPPEVTGIERVHDIVPSYSGWALVYDPYLNVTEQAAIPPERRTRRVFHLGIRRAILGAPLGDNSLAIAYHGHGGVDTFVQPTNQPYFPGPVYTVSNGGSGSAYHYLLDDGQLYSMGESYSNGIVSDYGAYTYNQRPKPMSHDAGYTAPPPSPWQ